MKGFLLASFALLLALSAVAWRLSPDADSSGRTTLVWVSDDNPLRRAQVAPFNKNHPDLLLTLDPGNAAVEKIIVQSLGGVGPDLFDCYSYLQLAAYVQSGIAWNVTDELAKLNIDVKRDTWPATHTTCIFEGRIYGHPTNAAVNGTWYHKDILASAGITLPAGAWTWEQMIPIAQALTEKDRRGRITRYGLLIDWDNNFAQFILQWGGRIYTPDGTRCVIDSPQCIAAMQFLHELIYRHRVSPTPSEESAIASAGGWGGGAGSSITLFGARKGAMAIGGRWWLCRLRDPEYRHLRLGAVECPTGPQRIFIGYGKSTLINSNSPRREQALKFLQYLHSPAYNQLINRQADGIGPVIASTESSDFLLNPEHPEEDYNAVWRDMMKLAVPEQVSPFIHGAIAQRFLKNQIDMIRANEKPVPQAMRDAARQINAVIADNLKTNHELRKRYEALTKGGPR